MRFALLFFAVTLSIWFHSWSEHRHEQQEVGEFLRGLKDDLKNDYKLLEKNKNIITAVDSNFHSILSFKEGLTGDLNQDTVVSRYFKFETAATHPNIGRYEGFKSSGKIGTIENDSLKQHILVYYQQTIPDLVYGENYINSLQLKIMDLGIDRSDKESIRDIIKTQKMQILFKLGGKNFEESIDAYKKALEQIKKMIAEIDKELGE